MERGKVLWKVLNLRNRLSSLRTDLDDEVLVMWSDDDDDDKKESGDST